VVPHEKVCVFKKLLVSYKLYTSTEHTFVGLPENLSMKLLIISSDTPAPNVMIEWLALLLHIREVSASNLGLETTILDFPQSLQDCTLNYAMTASFHIVYIPLFIVHNIDAI
jgi:hypothetical protein